MSRGNRSRLPALGSLAALGTASRRAWMVWGVALAAVVLSGHVGSPDVFFTGKAGAYDVRVVVRPPDVVPGIARVTVRTPPDVQRVSIRPVYWRAGSRGAPSADETRRLQGDAQTFEGSLWLMARGAYTVEVTVEGTRGAGTAQVPVASVATGRLTMGPALGALLAALGIMLIAGLVNIVYKGAGESLTEPGIPLDDVRRARARRAAAIAVPVLALAVLGGARWWRAVDQSYERTMYRPSPLEIAVDAGTLHLRATDTLWQPPGRPSALIPDHGKLMHLFLVRADDAAAFAHLHPQPTDTSAVPSFAVRVPPLPAGTYHAFADVVHETGFERTLVGSVVLAGERRGERNDGGSVGGARRGTPSQEPGFDPDDAWFVGGASRERSTRLADGSTMSIEILPNGVIQAGREETIRVSVSDRDGRPAALEPYLGMTAHAVVMRVDGKVYVHLHPMGTITLAAQQAFMARDRGDTTETGRLRLDHAGHAIAPAERRGPTGERPQPSAESGGVATEFPYAFPKGGSYRLFVQVRRNGRILTGAFAVAVAEPVPATR